MKPFNFKSVCTIICLEFNETIRRKWWLTYSCSLFVLSLIIFILGTEEPLRASISLMNLILLLIPLFSLLFGVISFTESIPFQEILTSLTVTRNEIYFGKWLGLSLALSSAYVTGINVPGILIFEFNPWFVDCQFLTIFGVILTFIFLSISFLLVNIFKKRELIFGITLLFWLFLFLLYDVLIMQFVIAFGDYPLEIPISILVFLNPIDLMRTVLNMQLNLSDMMGYSGAIFQQYFAPENGIILLILVLILWIVIPISIGSYFFSKKDL